MVKMKKISLRKLLELENINIIDIRDIDEFNIKHISNSINIPSFKLYQTYTLLLNKYETYYIICEKGIRSKQMVKFLKRKKYNVVYIKNGISKLDHFNF